MSVADLAVLAVIFVLVALVVIPTLNSRSVYAPATAANVRSIANAYQAYSNLGTSPPAKAPAIAPPTVQPVTPLPTTSAVTDTAAVVDSAVPTAATKKAMQQIAMALLDYSTRDDQWHLLAAGPGDTAHTIALELARTMPLNDAAIYFVSGDPKAPNPPPTLVTDPAFAKATLSIEFAANIPSGTSPTITPIAWTRGLREDGTWAPDSPFGGKGGYIIYRDGHVEWVDGNLQTESHGFYLIMNGTDRTPTINIREALPPGAVILSAEPNGPQR